MSSFFGSLNLPASISGYVVVVAALAIVVKLSRPSTPDAIPTVGSTSWLSSWWAAFKYVSNAQVILQQGYEKHKPAPFKIAELYHWTVVLNSREHVEELRGAPSDALSFAEAVNDQVQVEHTMSHQVYHNPYHAPVIRSRLTRNIEALYPEILDEMTKSFNDVLGLQGNEWKGIPAHRSMQMMVCRTSNRIFVGLPLCRDPDWIDLTLRYTVEVMKAAVIIRPFPKFLKPVAIRFLTNIEQVQQRGRKLLRPIVEQRQRSLKEYGNEWAANPNDLLSLFMEEADGPELTEDFLTSRMLMVNFVSLHTFAASFTHALLYLAANPQYIQPLREEVEIILEKEGWSQAALDKMRKIDSFLQECQRLEGFNSTSMTRKALKDFTFSDGTFIPKGTMVTVASRWIHRDEAFYENAHAFEPFRFSDLHREEDDKDMKHGFASTAPDYLPFGYGKHACPGRFLAGSQLKSMLAYIVATFDVRLPDNATHPRALHFATAVVPDPSAQVMFRRRVD